MSIQEQTITKINHLMTKWLSNTNSSYIELTKQFFGKYINLNQYWSISPDVELEDPVDDEIILITQFFISKDKKRQNELITSLQVNVANPFINKIILLNEREYTKEELGSSSDKIKQIVISKRLSFRDVFEIVEKEKLNGYIVLSNLDIFFDKTINIIKKTGISHKKMFFSLLRYEYYPGMKFEKMKLFYHYSDSQDTWIWHSNFNLNEKERNVLDFQLGIPGCDNTITYMAMVLGFEVINDPVLIKSYHNHITKVRNYDSNTIKTLKPYFCVHPPRLMSDDNSIKIDMKHPFNFIGENMNFKNYLKEKITNNKNFIVPRLAGIEHMFAIIGLNAKNKGMVDNNENNFLNSRMSVMKNNAGIKLENIMDVINYSDNYLSAFEKCDGYFDWEPYGNVACGYGGLLEHMYEVIQKIHPNHKRFWSLGVLDIFHLIKLPDIWTQELSNKRILIISSFSETFKKQLPNLSKIYDRDLFPNCEFLFLIPPATNGINDSEIFTIELDKFSKNIEEIKDKFDIALVSCGGYGNLILNRIYDMGKSAIYVGGVLQMFFGVYGSRWERERELVMKLYKNEYWVRPSANERPNGFENVEQSCYW